MDVRVIAATNRNLEEVMEQGLFRSDLYYRLNVVPIHLLPLREPCARSAGRATFASSRNVIERSAILCDGAELCLPESMVTDRRTDAALPFDAGLTLEDMKRRYIRHVLSTTRGNMPRAAAILAIDRRSLYRIVERYGIARPGRVDRSEGTDGGRAGDHPGMAETREMASDRAAHSRSIPAW